MEKMVKLRDVKTGENIELDLDNINIFNPKEREWDVIEGLNEVEKYFYRLMKAQNADFSMREGVTIIQCYIPEIGMVNFKKK